MKKLILLIAIILTFAISSVSFGIVDVVTVCNATAGSTTGLCGANATTLKGQARCFPWVVNKASCELSGTHTGLNLDIDGSVGGTNYYSLGADDISANGNTSIINQPFQCLQADIDARTNGTVILKCIVSYY